MRVSDLSRLLITVPLLAVTAASQMLQPALAAESAGEEALRILARAKAIDARCGYLSGAERGELSQYAARAEMATASQSSASAAKRASAAGRSEAQAAGCTTSAKNDVRDTLYAAREAMAKVETKQPAKAASAPEATASTAAKDQRAGPAASSNALERYASVLGPYYLERQCRSLSRREDDRFWRGIVRLHKAAVAKHGAAVVAPLMHRAERQAKQSACGSRVLAEIRRGYERTMSR